MKEIGLTQGKIALVDDEDYPYLSKFKWCAHKTGKDLFYAKRTTCENGKQTNISMHRLILGVTDKNIWVDHKDRNTLNNTRSNLRLATNAQNIANQRHRTDGTSKYRGVNWCKYARRWLSHISVSNPKKTDIDLGSYYNELAAAKAYNDAAIKYYGEFASLNEIPKDADLTDIDRKHELQTCHVIRLSESETDYLLDLIQHDSKAKDKTQFTTLLKLNIVKTTYRIGSKSGKKPTPPLHQQANNRSKEKPN